MSLFRLLIGACGCGIAVIGIGAMTGQFSQATLNAYTMEKVVAGLTLSAWGVAFAAYFSERRLQR
jgi:hypothetical protein